MTSFTHNDFSGYSLIFLTAIHCQFVSHLLHESEAREEDRDQRYDTACGSLYKNTHMMYVQEEKDMYFLDCKVTSDIKLKSPTINTDTDKDTDIKTTKLQYVY